MYGEACDFFSIVPKNLENINDINNYKTEDLLNDGNRAETSSGKKTLIEKARQGLDNIRSQPWSGAAADILQVSGQHLHIKYK